MYAYCRYVHVAKHIFVCVRVCAEKGLAGLGPLSAGTPCGEEEAPQNQVISLPPSLQRPPIPWAPYTARGNQEDYTQLPAEHLHEDVIWKTVPQNYKKQQEATWKDSLTKAKYENKCQI